MKQLETHLYQYNAVPDFGLKFGMKNAWTKVKANN